MINTFDKTLLSLAVFKWKIKFLNALIASLLPLDLPDSPFRIFMKEIHKPFLKLCKRDALGKCTHLLRRNIAVGHLDADILELVLKGIDIAVAHRLRFVDRNGSGQSRYMAVNALDLVNRGAAAVLLRKDAVSAALYGHLYRYTVIGDRKCDRKGNLGTVGRTHTLLKLLMDARTLLHGIRVGETAFGRGNIAASQNKFHEISHGYFDGMHGLLLSVCPVLFLFLKQLFQHVAVPEHNPDLICQLAGCRREILVRQNHSNVTFIESTSGIDLLHGFDPDIVIVAFALDRERNSIAVRKDINAEITARLGALGKLKAVGGKNIAGQCFEIRTGNVIQIGQ